MGAEILAAGAIPDFEGIEDAPPFVVPFLPREQLVKAQRELKPYLEVLEPDYNTTVHNLLRHTRRCVTSEAMAAYVLRQLGLWPARRPLGILYICCGWSWKQ